MSRRKQSIPQLIAAYMATAPLDEARIVLDVARAVLDARAESYAETLPRVPRVRKPKAQTDENAAQHRSGLW